MSPIQVGEAIIVIDPSPPKWRDRPQYLKATITVIKLNNSPKPIIEWECGAKRNVEWMDDEGHVWIRGHGPRARAALEAARRLLKDRT